MLEDSSRRIVIGDVHGHYEGLRQLFSLLDLQEHDTVYFLGDLIDRGPASAQVVEFVRTHGYPCLLGNHEQMMQLAFQSDADDFTRQGWLAAGGHSTLDSYRSCEDQVAQDLCWMETLPIYLDLGDFWLVHAGVHPHISLEQQSAQEFCWIRKEFHQMQQPFFTDKTILTGHTITFTFPGVEPGQLAQGVGWIDIDTGAYHPRSGWMTALDIVQKQVYQVNVFDRTSRIRPLSEAVTPIQPLLPRQTSSTRKGLVSRISAALRDVT
jgi:serine/threonine protein phosphatase 1